MNMQVYTTNSLRFHFSSSTCFYFCCFSQMLCLILILRLFRQDEQSEEVHRSRVNTQTGQPSHHIVVCFDSLYSAPQLLTAVYIISVHNNRPSPDVFLTAGLILRTGYTLFTDVMCFSVRR